MGKRGPKAVPLGELVFWEGLWYWVFFHLRGPSAPSDAKLAMNADIKNQLRDQLQEIMALVPKDDIEKVDLSEHRRQLESDLEFKPNDSEPAVWRILIAARTAADIHRACTESKRWLNPNWQGRPYVRDLYEHADKFVKAKKNPYYPRQDSGDEKRVVFFARAMAGITLELSPETAIDRLRKHRHNPKCPCVHCDIKRWDRIEEQMYERVLATESGRDSFIKLKRQRRKP